VATRPHVTLPHLSRLDTSAIKGTVSSIPYDYLVFAVGAEVQTFGIPGVKEKACFMKELADAEKVRL
jgi:NADH:ubiquinone reductase (non-electrogenic)